MIISVIGTGFVGGSLEAGMIRVAKVLTYDKYNHCNSTLDEAVNGSKIVFLCLPTPMNKNGSCNTSILESVVEEADRLAKDCKIFCIKSTVPPGTTQRLQEKYTRHTFVFSPEFLTERNAIMDFLTQDRVILGTEKEYCDIEPLVELWNKFIEGQTEKAKLVITNTKEAEMAKYVGNCFLAAKVTFFNEMYDICKAMGIKYEEVTKLASLDERIGCTHMQVPGPDGYRYFGGKCLPKDLNTLIYLSRLNNTNATMLSSAWKKCLKCREVHDWNSIPGATTKNNNFKK